MIACAGSRGPGFDGLLLSAVATCLSSPRCFCFAMGKAHRSAKLIEPVETLRSLAIIVACGGAATRAVVNHSAYAIGVRKLHQRRSLHRGHDPDDLIALANCRLCLRQSALTLFHRQQRLGKQHAGICQTVASPNVLRFFTNELPPNIDAVAQTPNRVGELARIVL